METVRSIQSDLAYFKQLVGAGWDGVTATRRELDEGVFMSPLQAVVWGPTAIGATIGMLSSRATGSRKSALRMALGGLIGSVLGFGAALAWASREFTGPAARRAVRHVNAARDAHWLETHPIDYA